ncbi:MULTISPECIES: restriction endonuclease [Acinetobacter]|uniref:restriction endonuclease n=1 Tax=Acinetobacter TaxID=469 RepID=UPI000CEC9CA6|nr:MULTISPECIES: restriction endonuclease [Acinetobacter]MCP0917612.1 restriction endonuclease [Acinetobacter indicus]MCP0920725.1 restriction endonuclease [Acinetobacter indicus]MCP0923392.1 restriction endonuclease [Acinetobacter indicus]MDM1273700.1 restriction endonuclease [Acinetobacter indicus]MDM1279242.1 restriction endonuclease [Acinetobacter indicus]
MSLPTYDQLMLPLMRLLSELDQPIKISDAADVLAERSNLSEEDLNQTLPSGKNIFKDRVSWAKTYLVKAGLIQQPKRAYCEISDLGRTIDLKNLNAITNEFLAQFDGFKSFKFGKKNEDESEVKTLTDAESLNVYPETQTPEETIQTTTELLKSNLKNDLLQIIKDKSPLFFERLVVDLLVAMGYGGSHQDAAQAIGKTNDGGIDGVISEDRLGLDKIYIQAKRWENTVGRPDIQQFKGALADQVAKKGVFITTSSFSKEAIESAKKSGIVLIDGNKLTSLMIEFGLGVQIERSFHIYKIDQDRFDEDNF